MADTSFAGACDIIQRKQKTISKGRQMRKRLAANYARQNYASSTTVKCMLS